LLGLHVERHPDGAPAPAALPARLPRADEGDELGSQPSAARRGTSRAQRPCGQRLDRHERRPVTRARLAPGGLRDVGPFVWTFSRLAGRVAGTEPPAVFLTLGRNRRLFWGWLHFAGRLMPGGRLPRRDTELVILRVASRAGSEYEWTQHAAMGRRAGLTDAQVEALREDDPHTLA